MAPRILHFAKKKLLWECASKIWAEDFGLADPPSLRLGGLEARKLSIPFMWPTRPGLKESYWTKRLDAFSSRNSQDVSSPKSPTSCPHYRGLHLPSKPPILAPI